MHGARRRPAPTPKFPDSHRFETTLSSDLKRVADQLAGSEAYDTSKRVGKLRETKLANTATSISFGNEVVNYVSDAMETQKQGGAPPSYEERMAQRAKLKSMKSALTKTNFTLGDEIPEYASANRTAMAKADAYQYKQPIMNSELKAAVKASSVHFGNESTNYTSCSHEGYVSRITPNTTKEREAKKAEIAEQTAKLRKHNFSFGEEKIEYLSDQTRGYGSVPVAAYSQRQQALPKIRETIQDSRSCHFSLGLDKVNYESNTHSGFKGGASESATSRAEGLERIKQMKRALQTTSIVIGDDERYM